MARLSRQFVGLAALSNKVFSIVAVPMGVADIGRARLHKRFRFIGARQRRERCSCRDGEEAQTHVAWAV